MSSFQVSFYYGERGRRETREGGGKIIVILHILRCGINRLYRSRVIVSIALLALDYTCCSYAPGIIIIQYCKCQVRVTVAELHSI